MNKETTRTKTGDGGGDDDPHPPHTLTREEQKENAESSQQRQPTRTTTGATTTTTSSSIGKEPHLSVISDDDDDNSNNGCKSQEERCSRHEHDDDDRQDDEHQEEEGSGRSSTIDGTSVKRKDGVVEDNNGDGDGDGNQEDQHHSHSRRNDDQRHSERHEEEDVDITNSTASTNTTHPNQQWKKEHPLWSILLYINIFLSAPIYSMLLCTILYWTLFFAFGNVGKAVLALYQLRMWTDVSPRYYGWDEHVNFWRCCILGLPPPHTSPSSSSDGRTKDEGVKGGEKKEEGTAPQPRDEHPSATDLSCTSSTTSNEDDDSHHSATGKSSKQEKEEEGDSTISTSSSSSSSCYGGGWRFRHICRTSFNYELVRQYFDTKLVRTVELKDTKERNYLFLYHPHGIISLGAATALHTDVAGFPKLFPGIHRSSCVLNACFLIPFFRDWMLMLGFVSPNRETIVRHLTTSVPHRKSLVLIPGGALEALYAHPGIFRLYLKNRKGFIRVALETGCSIVPCLGFGENEIFDTLRSDIIGPSDLGLAGAKGAPPSTSSNNDIQPTSTLLKVIRNILLSLQIRFTKLFTVSMPIVTNWIPRRSKLVVVVGEPMHFDEQHPVLKKRKNNIAREEENNGRRFDEEVVNECHRLYCAKLEELYDQHKGDYGHEKIKLEIV